MRCPSCPTDPGTPCIGERPGWAFPCEWAAGGDETSRTHVANVSLASAGTYVPPPLPPPPPDPGRMTREEAARVMAGAEACRHREKRPGCGCSGAHCKKYEKAVQLVDCVRCVRDGLDA